MTAIRLLALCLILAAPAGSGRALAAEAGARAPLDAQGRLMLRRGELVVIGLDAGFHITVKSVEAVGPGGALMRGTTPSDGTLTLYLGKDDTAGSFLRLENGSSLKLHYKAAIVVPRNGDLDVVPTSICPVPPRTSGLESWPNDVIGMVVGPFTEVDAQTNTCTK